MRTEVSILFPFPEQDDLFTIRLNHSIQISIPRSFRLSIRKPDVIFQQYCPDHNLHDSARIPSSRTGESSVAPLKAFGSSASKFVLREIALMII